jgi:hypothetical protein
VNDPNQDTEAGLSSAIAQAIADWHRQMRHRENGRTAEEILREAADDLHTLLMIDATVHPDRKGEAQKAVEAALAQLAEEAKRSAPNEDKKEKTEKTKGQQPTQAEVLTGAARAASTLFHTADGESFADLIIKGHRETHRVRGQGFRQWLRHQYYLQKRRSCSNDAVQQAVETVAAWARYEGDEREVFCRIAQHGEAIFIDLGDPNWRAIKVTKHGWEVIDEPPVRFRRSPGARALPDPERGGKIDLLRPFCNVQSEGEFVLLVAFLLGALRPNAAYPVLVLGGEHGTSKSTLVTLVARLVDPRIPELRSPPANEDDVVTAAKAAHLLAYDNISRLPDWLSDAVCRLATGGGAGKRRLYTDDDEILFAGRRPVCLNGIEDIAVRADLVDRAINLTLEPIAESKRRKEEEFHADFASKAPLIFGCLLDGLVAGLGNRHIEIAGKPRMADFAVWAEGCTRAYWPEGTFLAAYRNALASSVDLIIEASAVGSAVRTFMANRAAWKGTATELLPLLTTLVGEQAARAQEWPKRPNRLSGALRRVASALRKTGTHIEMTREGHGGAKTIAITKRNHPTKTSSAPSAPSAADLGSIEINDLEDATADDGLTMGGDQTLFADDTLTMAASPTVSTNGLKNNETDDGDDGDDVLPLSTEGVSRPLKGGPGAGVTAASNGSRPISLLCHMCTDPIRPGTEITIRSTGDGQLATVHSGCLSAWETREPQQ